MKDKNLFFCLISCLNSILAKTYLIKLLHDAAIIQLISTISLYVCTKVFAYFLSLNYFVIFYALTVCCNSNRKTDYRLRMRNPTLIMNQFQMFFNEFPFLSEYLMISNVSTLNFIPYLICSFQ